jgi:tRNA A-37 threonylcarbamoyl transferase component Bud32
MTTDPQLSGMEGLVVVVQRLSLARDLARVQEIVRRAARRLTGADGATFVLRDGDRCFYADEDAIAPLWKGQRFPMSACISGWSMLNRRPAIIDDIYADSRIPHDAYRPTFVKSLVMVPIRTLDPIGAIGNYWASPHHPSPAEGKLLQALADTTAVALENVGVFTELEDRVKARTAELETANRRLESANRELLAAQQQADRVFRAYARALPGTVLDGKYRLEDELGTGGFGVVFRGRHVVLDSPIAVKVFRPVPGNDSALELQRFLREGAAAARLAHPNAVRVFDSGLSAEGVAFLTMELLTGRSLAVELAERGALPLRRSVAIAARVADVLAMAHRQGILHRDIKPANVFLHQEASAEVVKVVDFGMTRFFDGAQPPGSDRLTRTGELLGTPSFLAPERIAGGADDGRSDVFSLGVMLYQMICGAMPWSIQEQLRVICGLGRSSPPAPMSEHRRGVPGELEALVGRSLAWAASERPTAAELAAALERLPCGLGDSPAELVHPAAPSVAATMATPAPASTTELAALAGK